MLLFFKERWEQFAHGCSFLRISKTHSLLLFFKERLEQMSDFEQKSKFPTLSFKGCLFLRNTHYDTDEEILLELYAVFTEI